MLAAGDRSPACAVPPRSRSHSSNCVSFEKSASTAPALVPVAINGAAAPVDHANVAVRGISRRRTILIYGVAIKVRGGIHLRARGKKLSEPEQSERCGGIIVRCKCVQPALFLCVYRIGKGVLDENVTPITAFEEV